MNAPSKPLVTSKNAAITFYDIESLRNAFTLAAYSPRLNRTDVFYLIDDSDEQHFNASISPAEATRRAHKANPAYGERAVFIHDLHKIESVELLISLLGFDPANGSKNGPIQLTDTEEHIGARFSLVNDTELNYSPIYDGPEHENHPYLAGYNSSNYDMTMLAMYFSEIAPYFFRRTEHLKNTEAPYDPTFVSPTAATMRAHNDKLFTEHIKRMRDYLRASTSDNSWNALPNQLYYSMMNTGRFIDIAKFKETQSKTALKQQCAVLGLQILESEKLSGPNAFVETIDDIYDLFAYNISDVVNLEKLFLNKTYASSFELRKALLDQYPTTTYNNIPGTEEANVKPNNLRRMRLVPDSTSAQFVANILAPYTPLDDIKCVDYTYPHPDVAKELGIEPVNVLEAAREFFYTNCEEPSARAAFDEIYTYYKEVEGKNFNDSERYAERFGYVPVTTWADITPRKMNIPYYRRDGKPTSCFITMSTGGIHGQELNIDLYKHDQEKTRNANSMLTHAIEKIMRDYPDATAFRQACAKQPVGCKDRLELSDGTVVYHKDVLATGSTLKHATFKTPKVSNLVMFPEKSDGSNEVNKAYNRTSVGYATHEDFSSYYPNMLRNMKAFYNAKLGVDYYSNIYDDKQRYGKLMKDMSLSAEERELYALRREGTKLVLNTATGAGDAKHDNSIRMNNRIISMRIIGQLNTWRIGQAQAFEGANIVSTNTDGLYSMNLSFEQNETILERESKIVNVEIEPEKVLLVSKDSNNRLEIHENGEVMASGPYVGSFSGPEPTRKATKPAIIDYALAEYFKAIVNESDTRARIDARFNNEFGREILENALHTMDKVKIIQMFQNIIRSSDSSITYPFACDLNADLKKIENPIILQKFNRVVIVKQGTPGAKSLRNIGAWTVPATTVTKRRQDPELNSLYIKGDQQLRDMMKAYGYSHSLVDVNKRGYTRIPPDKDVAVRRISGHAFDAPSLIINDDLNHLPNIDAIIDSIDVDAYLFMVAEAFEKTWMNYTPDNVVEIKSARKAEAKARRDALKAAQADEDDESDAA